LEILGNNNAIGLAVTNTSVLKAEINFRGRMSLTMAMHRKVNTGTWKALALAGCLLTPASGQAFSPDVMTSVVPLLPAWPGWESNATSNTGRPENPEGTAVAIMPGGYLVTNVHVLGAAEKADIQLADGRLVAIEIIARDQLSDIALIKAPMDIPIPVFGPPPGLGEKVCAVGNQFGLGLSVSCGVVSALNRTGTGFNPIEDFIQTDAAVNPGGSGGALFDDRSRLVGLVSAIFTKKRDANIGVNFATSMRLVRRVVEDLKLHGRVLRGEPGLTLAHLTAEQLRAGGGALITEIERAGAAFIAGLQAGDIVTAVGTRIISTPADFIVEVHMYRPGDSVEIKYRRENTAFTTILTIVP
jgi:S1-C subfamily serine protease